MFLGAPLLNWRWFPPFPHFVKSNIFPLEEGTLFSTNRFKFTNATNFYGFSLKAKQLWIFSVSWLMGKNRACNPANQKQASEMKRKKRILYPRGPARLNKDTQRQRWIIYRWPISLGGLKFWCSGRRRNQFILSTFMPALAAFWTPP